MDEFWLKFWGGSDEVGGGDIESEKVEILRL
jgi:hypothetical protein